MHLFETLWYRWLKRPIKLKKRIRVGEGAKTLVLLHGIADNAETWNPLVKLINKAKWTVTGVDLLGFGKSPKPSWSSYDVDEHVRAIHKTLRLRPRQKITLIGHSMGCIIATHFAKTYPTKVNRLILYEPAFFSQESTDSSIKNRKRLYFTVYEHIMNNPKLALFYGKLGSNMIRGLSHASINDQVWVSFERSLKNTILSQESLEELRQLTIPIDIIYGRFDLIVSRANIDELLKDKPNITFHTVADMHGISRRSAKFILSLLDA
jgi:pimeloyl-ACP methyl ester carboxylesterase